LTQKETEAGQITKKTCLGSLSTCPLNKEPRSPAETRMWRLSRDAMKKLGGEWGTDTILRRMLPIRKECENIKCEYLQATKRTGVRVSCNICDLVIATTEYAGKQALETLTTLASLGPCPKCHDFSLMAYPISETSAVVKLNIYQYLVQKEGRSPGLVVISQRGKPYCLCPKWRYNRLPPKHRKCPHLEIFAFKDISNQPGPQ